MNSPDAEDPTKTLIKKLNTLICFLNEHEYFQVQDVKWTFDQQTQHK